MEELQPEDIEDLLQELEGEYSAEEVPAPEVETKARVCPECGKHNLENAWHCIDCGTTLSVKTLMNMDELSVPRDPEALAEEASALTHLEASLKTHGRRGVTGQQSGSLIRCMVWSSVAGLAAGLVLGWYAAEPGGGTSCLPWFLVPLTVGAIVGAVVQGRKDRIAGIATGVAFTAVVAWLSGFVIFLWRIIQMGGP